MAGIAGWAVAVVLAGSAWAAETFTKEQLEARFHYDLGPAEVDVSSYPKRQQENYLVFQRTCSQCHTLARPINSPLSKREDWRRYVRRMHVHTKVRSGTTIAKEQAKAIVDFLAFDSQRRKVERKAGFKAKDKELQAFFEEIKRERTRIRLEEDKAKARPFEYRGQP